MALAPSRSNSHDPDHPSLGILQADLLDRLWQILEQVLGGAGTDIEFGAELSEICSPSDGQFEAGKVDNNHLQHRVVLDQFPYILSSSPPV